MTQYIAFPARWQKIELEYHSALPHTPN